MTERPPERFVYWPFLLVDLIFIGIAGAIFNYGHRPLLLWEVYALILCAAVGAWSFLAPFRAKLRLVENDRLASTLDQINKLEHIAQQVVSSTSLWQAVQEQSTKTADAARQIGEKMTAEAQAFSEFLVKANDSEKGHLRLEIDKLKRSETEWVQTTVRMLDHVYALHQGALQSGQPRLIEQIGNFQNACRDAARRVGLMPIIPNASDAFDQTVHQLETNEKAPADSRVGATLAPGYTFQGRIVRPALVRLAQDADSTTPRTKGRVVAPAPQTAELPL